MPLQKPQLFNAIHAAMADLNSAKGVLQIADRFGAAPHASRRLLVADDSETNRKVIRLMLERAGHEVDLVSDGEEALDALEDNTYDLVVVDLQMPGLGGLDVIGAFRFGVGLGNKMPFVVLSANATTEAKRECKEAGGDAFLTKPIDAKLLNATIANLTTTGRQESSASSHRRQSESITRPQNRNQEPSVDLDVLDNLAELSGDPTILNSVMRSFTQDSEQLFESMSRSLESRNYTHFRDAAHALKGNSGSIGAMQLLRKAEEAQRAKHETLASGGVALLEDLKTLYNDAQSDIRDYLARQPRDANPSG